MIKALQWSHRVPGNYGIEYRCPICDSLSTEGHKENCEIKKCIDEWDGKADGRITCDFSAHATDSCTPELLTKVREEANKMDKMITIQVGGETEKPKENKDAKNTT